MALIAHPILYPAPCHVIRHVIRHSACFTALTTHAFDSRIFHSLRPSDIIKNAPTRKLRQLVVRENALARKLRQLVAHEKRFGAHIAQRPTPCRYTASCAPENSPSSRELCELKEVFLAK